MLLTVTAHRVPDVMLFQCFDAVGWAAGRASGLQKLYGEVLTWLLVICLEQGANDLHMVQLMPLPPHHLLLQSYPEWF